MATFRGFEEIEAWKKARELTRLIYEITATGPFARDFGLKDQIRRAAVSIMSNIAEGFERGGNKEFAFFLGIAKGSAGEVRSHLYVAADANFIDENQFQTLSQLANETSRLIGGLMKYVGQCKLPGTRFPRQRTDEI